MTVDDSELAVRAAAGDRDAFTAIVDRHGGRVRAVALRIAGGRESWADDLVQELFLHLLRALPRYDRARPFAPWLMQVAANLFRNKLRDERRRPHASLDALADAGAEDPPSAARDDPADRAGARDEARQVRDARDALPTAYRAILAMRYEADLSYEDIGAALGGLPIGTVKNRLHRARAALAAKLAREEGR